MSRYKVTVAKERISRLTEKYTRGFKQDDDIATNSSESLISMTSRRSSDEEKHVQQHSKIFSNNVSLRSVNNVPSDSLEGEFDSEIVKVEEILDPDLETYRNDIHRSKINVAEHKLKKSPSSGSLVLSDLSTQFERIRFISSSSDDLSIVESENSQSKSSTKITLQDIISEKLTIFSEKDKQMSTFEENIKIFHRSEENSSLSMSPLSEANDLTEISSIKEIMNSETEKDNTSEDKSLLDNVKNSDNDTKNPNYSQKSNYRELSLKLRSSSNSPDDNDSLTNTAAKMIKQGPQSTADKSSKCMPSDNQSNVINDEEGEYTWVRTPIAQNVSKLNNAKAALAHPKTIHCTNKSTNTEPVKVSLLNKFQKHHKNKHVTHLNKATSNVTKYKHTKLDIERVGASKEKAMKRTFIKPCPLITQEEIKNIDCKRMTTQEPHWLKFNLTDDFYSDHISSTLGINHEDVITQLLKNQIHLTRHFIESHQRMYLQVCQAAELLNENHSPYC